MARTKKQQVTGPQRLLGVVRLSHLTDETLSPEVQRERIQATAAGRGDTLVHIAEDLDVSGAVSAWNRDLAPWLEDPDRIALWDSLLVAKLDRLTRSLLDFQRLLEWCDKHNKGIISVSEGFDLSNPVGRLIANILVMFAEFERERMGERRSERAQADKERGWWGGGRTKYGQMAVKVGNHYEVRPDPDEIAVIERMARDLLAGKSASHIARQLTAEGIPTKLGEVKSGPKAGQQRAWKGSTIKDILTDPGTPLDAEVWSRVQAVIRDSAKPKGHRYDAAMLAGVARCGECGTEMWAQHTRRGDAVWDYYRCYNHECNARMVRVEDLDAIVDQDITENYGDVEIRVKRLIPGSDKQAKLAEIDRAIAKLDQDAADYDDKHAILRKERKRVKDAPAEPDRYVWEPTGETIGSMWQSLDTQGKRAWLMEHGWRVMAWAPERRGGLPRAGIDAGFTEGKGVEVHVDVQVP